MTLRIVKSNSVGDCAKCGNPHHVKYGLGWVCTKCNFYKFVELIDPIKK